MPLGTFIISNESNTFLSSAPIKPIENSKNTESSSNIMYAFDSEIESVYLNLKITKIHVIEDRDFGSGEVYLRIHLNGDSYTFDNDGNYYIANDDDYISTSIQISKTFSADVTSYRIRIDGYESDYDADDYMGGLLLSYTQDTVENSTSWRSLDTYPPDGGNHDIQLEVYISISFTIKYKATTTTTSSTSDPSTSNTSNTPSNSDSLINLNNIDPYLVIILALSLFSVIMAIAYIKKD